MRDESERAFAAVIGSSLILPPSALVSRWLRAASWCEASRWGYGVVRKSISFVARGSGGGRGGQRFEVGDLMLQGGERGALEVGGRSRWRLLAGGS